MVRQLRVVRLTGKARNTDKAGNIGTTGRVVDWWTLVDRQN